VLDRKDHGCVPPSAIAQKQLPDGKVLTQTREGAGPLRCRERAFDGAPLIGPGTIKVPPLLPDRQRLGHSLTC
jgi:hypothetical protein